MEVVSRCEFFHCLLQRTDDFHLVCSGGNADVDEVFPASPVGISFTVNEETHRLGIVVIAERTVFYVLTKTYYREVAGSSKLVNFHPRIFLAGGFIEYIHIAIARLEVASFSDPDTHYF